MRGYFGVGVEGISKSYNLGAVLRTANAFGASFAFTIRISRLICPVFAIPLIALIFWDRKKAACQTIFKPAVTTSYKYQRSSVSTSASPLP